MKHRQKKLWPWLLAGGGLAALYFWSKSSGASGSSKIGWTYQGTPQPKATSTGKVMRLTLVPGVMKVTWPVGATGWFALPAGAVWASNDPQLYPTSLGGDVVGGQPPDKESGLVGLAGAGTVEFNWTDAKGPHQTLVDLRTV